MENLSPKFLKALNDFKEEMIFYIKSYNDSLTKNATQKAYAIKLLPVIKKIQLIEKKEN